jgi:hypothetical protein
VTPPDAPVRTDSFRPVLGATVLLVFALLAIAALKSSRDLEAARARERLLQTRITETRARSERLRVRIPACSSGWRARTLGWCVRAT